MNYQLTTEKEKGYSPLQMPKVGCGEDEILGYRDLAFGDHNTFRTRRLENAARNLLYVSYTRHWIQLDTKHLKNGSRGFFFADIPNGGQTKPRPVTNLVALSVRAELAALVRRKLVPNVIPRSRDPRAEAAAKVSKEILQDRLKKLNWSDKRHLFTFLDIVCGMGIIKSYWDETITDVGYYDNPEAMGCLECDSKLSSPFVDKDTVSKAPSRPADLQEMEGGEGYLMSTCPTCEGQKPIIPISLDQELAKQKDYFGRPLGTVIPKGQTSIEIVSPFDFYPENSGVDVDWNTMKVWRQATPRSLDWVCERYPHLEGQIEPTPAKELMENHPILGEWDIRGRFDANLDADIYANHVMVYEIYQEKGYKFPNGRAIVIVGDKVAFDGELYRKGLGQNSVPIVKYAGANWEPRHRDIWGKSQVDDLISPQNRINGMDAQIIWAREKFANPTLVLAEDASADGPEFFTDGGRDIARFRINPLNPNFQPYILGGVTAPPQIDQERASCENSILKLGGPTQVQSGWADKNVTTTTGLKLLDENADKLRAPHEDLIVSAYEKVWQHQLELLWNLRVEPDSYETQNEAGNWEQKQYDRMALMGQTKVEIEKQSEVDKSIYQSEAVREALADGLYGPVEMLSHAAKKRLLELRGLPNDVNEDTNYQIECGKKQWVDFVDEGVIPVIDPGLDDFLIRHQILSTYLLQDEGLRLANKIGWPKILKVIPQHIWEPKLMQVEAMDAAARAFYPTSDPMQAEMLYGQAQMQFETETQNFQSMQQKEAEASVDGAVNPMPLAPPQPPPPPAFLPGDKADHIYAIWLQLITEAGGLEAQEGSLDPQQVAMDRDNFLKFRAVVEAYRLLQAEKVMKEAMAMAPPAPAPGQPGSSPQLGGGLSPDAQGGIPQLGQVNPNSAGLQ